MNLKSRLSLFFWLFIFVPLGLVILTLVHDYGMAWSGGGCILGILCAKTYLSYYVFFLFWFLGFLVFLWEITQKTWKKSLICFLIMMSAIVLDDIQIFATKKTYDLSIKTGQCWMNYAFPGGEESVHIKKLSSRVNFCKGKTYHRKKEPQK